MLLCLFPHIPEPTGIQGLEVAAFFFFPRVLTAFSAVQILLLISRKPVCLFAFYSKFLVAPILLM